MLYEAFRRAFRKQSAKNPELRAQGRKDLSRVIRNVVVIKFSHTFPFDGDEAGTSEATGFVVDSKRG